ncbi:MAG TPA: divalent metal cation transporter [Puia sp.]|jgi:NRAMP (natural resistance-associated macrophage protein)-like metal ion transporter|nr:divalent metal cation transporter [Puia sp.]
MNRHSPFLQSLKRFWNTLGPGLITGASDDDPSAITTFSQAGARYGLVTLWIAILAFPILVVLQEMCARIGIVTGKGLTGVIKTHYPSWILYILIALSCPAFLLNMGADIAALGEAGNLLFPAISALYCSIGFTVLLFMLILLLPYKKLARIMKFICLSLLVYVIVPFLSPQNLGLIIRHSLVPSFHFDKEFLLIVTGLTGAIISPYLFFWQTSSEVEEMTAVSLEKKKTRKYTFLLIRKDILSGAFFAVLIMYFIILTTGTILHDHDIHNIYTVKDVAIALKPLAGNLSYILFSVGIIGTGFLIIPVLSASISYILTEAFNLKSGLSRSPDEARLFYGFIAIAMFFGITMHWLHISPVKALLFTTILYGITAPFLIGIILHVSNNKKIMGEFRNSRVSNIAGMFILLTMLTTVIVLGYFILLN